MSRPPATPPDLLRAIAAEDWPAALRCAARFQHLGDQDRAIRQAWAAYQRPAFYREIGHDPDALLAAGIAGLRARFTPPHSKTAPPVSPTPE